MSEAENISRNRPWGGSRQSGNPRSAHPDHPAHSAPRRAALVLLAAIALLAAFALTGCKYSDVLTQHTEDPSAGIDDTQEPTYKSNPDAEQIPNMADLTISDSNDENTQVEALPHYDPNAPDNGPTKQRVKSDETPHDEEASEGNEEGDADREGEGEGDKGGEGQSQSDGDNDGQQDGQEETVSDEAPVQGGLSDDAGTGGDQTIGEQDGSNEENPKGTVAAVGEYATIAQMLAGAGGLVAADHDWLVAREEDGCFSGELDNVAEAFTGNDEDGYTYDLDALKKAKPSVLVYDNSKLKLSDDDKSALKDAGIEPKAIAPLGAKGTEDIVVVGVVQQLADTLSDVMGAQYDPAVMLSNYESLHDQILKASYDANDEGYSYKLTDFQTSNWIYQNNPYTQGLDTQVTTRCNTAYIDSWKSLNTTVDLVRWSGSADDDNTETIENCKVKGVGLSVKDGTGSFMLVDYYLQLGGVVNMSYDLDKPASNGKATLVVPGDPSLSGYESFLSLGSPLNYLMGTEWKIIGERPLSDDANDFPAVITATTDIADKVAEAGKDAKSIYRTDNPYRAIVMPSGIAGSWSEAHFDSFMAALWAWGVRDPDNLDIWVDKNFLSTFYTGDGGNFPGFLRCDSWEDAVQNWKEYRIVGE